MAEPTTIGGQNFRQAFSQWSYMAKIPFIPPAMSYLLSRYSNIPESAQEAHILKVRERAYAHHPFPCLGRFRFLKLDLSTHPTYASHILPTLKAPSNSFTSPHDPKLLDIGTCLGQDLRKLIFDGVDPARLYGGDIGWEFINAGYELFQDEQRLPRERFIVPANVLDESRENALRVLDGQCDVISAIAVFHLFDLPEQVKMAKRLVRLLRKDPGGKALIVGAHVGKKVAGVETRGRGLRYRHNDQSWREFWSGILGSDEWRHAVASWEVESRMVDPGRILASDEHAQYMRQDEGISWQVWWVWVSFK